MVVMLVDSMEEGMVDSLAVFDMIICMGKIISVSIHAKRILCTAHKLM